MANAKQEHDADALTILLNKALPFVPRHNNHQS